MTITNVEIKRTHSPAMKPNFEPDPLGATVDLATITFTDHDGTRRVTMLGRWHSIGGRHWTNYTDAEIIAAVESNKLHIARR